MSTTANRGSQASFPNSEALQVCSPTSYPEFNVYARRSSERGLSPYHDNSKIPVDGSVDLSLGVGIYRDLSVSKEASRARRICGRRTNSCLIILLVTLIALGAVIGGAVGGTLGGEHSSLDISDPSPTPTLANHLSTTTPTATTTTIAMTPLPPSAGTSSTTGTVITLSITTTTLANPTYTLLRDCPSSDNMIETVDAGISKFAFRKACGTTYLGSSLDGINVPLASLDECIQQCGQWNENEHRNASGALTQCDAVNWRNTLDDEFPGQCFGITNGGSVPQIDYTQSNPDGALWLNMTSNSGG